ncbi:hypothetical protein JH06_2185 [Blastocystis sp. subtype 4]|uniref:hypothetical protein n=1 Tax=Blastocystis sp. subtype 4 TaxID=944170 RepID=UPI000711E132|nr:hypothetical protein JH06_2185 [Blastocystis sp. subtype 4]KNB46140.1 hypothetical protein JH06_2185 [Blastocystis sp. subtype 4]|eukprot:XP_014529594.1 hypothetical protein JH06_2185 [Blastocystis sp. subtype 4]
MNEAEEEAAKVQVTEGEGDSQKQEIEKLRKVVQIFQTKLKAQSAKVAELTKQSELKDKIIAAAKDNLEKIQKERDEKVKALDELKSKKGGSSLEMFEGQTPEQVLERIQVGNDVWCLVKFPGGSNDDEDLEEEDDFHDTNCIWLSQDELIEHVNTIGCTLDLPPFSLSSSQAQQLRSELVSLQQSYEKLEEEYKKYRVDMDTDVMLWNKNSQIDSLKSTNTDIPMFTTTSAPQSQDDVESLRIQRQAMKEKNVKLSRQVESLRLDVEELTLKTEDDKRKLDLLKTECDEWRRKYKEEVKKKQTQMVDTEMSAVSDKETIESLKQELDYLRSKNEQMMVLVRKSQDGRPPSLRMGSISDGNETPRSVEGDINSNDILTKNVWDKSSRNHMQTAIMTIFQFTPEEVMEIRVGDYCLE